jgi:hypothetical protein
VGFVAKSAFWLGLVYSAMPFDSAELTAATPRAGYPLATSAGALRQSAGDWRSAIEVAAALCARDCPQASPAKARPSNIPALKERAAPGRRLPPEKSD